MSKLSPLDYALRLLGYRSRTKKELTEKLLAKKYAVVEVDEVIQKLASHQLLDDVRLAHLLARDRLEIFRRGRQAIYWELIKRGVDRDLAKDSTAKINDADELPVAEQLITSRLRQWQHLDPLTQKRRAFSLLSRRGFAPAVVKKTINEIIG